MPVWVIEEKDTSARVPGWYVVEEFKTQEEANRREQDYRAAGGRDSHYRTRQIQQIPPSPGHGLPPLTQEIAPQKDKPRPDLEKIQQAHAELTLQNIEKGSAKASKETITRLEQQAGRQRQDVVQQAIMMTPLQLEKEKARAREQRIIETKQRIVQAEQARAVGRTETGGIYNIPRTAVYSPGFSSALGAGVTGKETAGDIVRRYRAQAIDVSALPKTSTVEGKSIEEYPSARLEPSPAALGNIARRVQYERELSRQPVEHLGAKILESLFERQGREPEVSKESGRMVSVMPTVGIAGGARGIVTERTGFESQLGTGVPKWYATGKIGKAYVFGKEIGEKIKKRAELVRGDGTRAMGISDGSSYISVDLPMVASKGLRQIQGLGTKESRGVGTEAKRTWLNRFIIGSPEKPAVKSIIIDFPISVAKGFGKLVYAPKYFGGKPIIDIGQHKALEGDKPLRFDKDIGNVAFVASLAISPPIIQKVAYGAFIGTGAYQFFKQPTPESAGALTALVALPLLARGVSAAKEAPGNIRATLARRRDVPRIIREAERPVPYKLIPGIEGKPKIQEAIIRDKPIPGLEMAASKVLVGTPSKGIIAAKEAPPGADFKGIARITPKEPGPLTKKDNLIFEELGIEEAGILKIDKPRKKIIPFGFSTIGGRSIILATKTPEGLKLGAADISPYLARLRGVKTSEGYKIAGAMETKLIMKALEKSGTTARAREAVPTMQNILRRTRFTTSRYKRGLPGETERLPKAGVDILKDITKKEEGIMFGGYARATQLADVITIKGEPYKRIPRLRDIDIRFDKVSEEQLALITREALGRFRKKGIVAREIKDIPYAIEVRQPSGKFEKAVEFKGKEDIIDGEAVPEFVLGFRKAEKPTTIQGLKVTKLREELRGVTQGVARLRYKKGVPDIFPPEKRIKDIGSVVVSARTLLQSKIFGKGRLRKSIERFESLYPRKLVMQQLEKPQKVILADYTPSPRGQATKYGYLYLPTSPYDISTRAYPAISPAISRTPRYKSPISRSAVSRSVNRSISKSLSPSISKSISRSLYKSPISRSAVSRSVSRSISKSVSPSISKSISKSLSRSTSPIRSRSMSKSLSKSVSRSSSPIPTPKTPPSFPPPFRQSKSEYKRKRKDIGYGYFYRQFRLAGITLNSKKAKLKINYT